MELDGAGGAALAPTVHVCRFDYDCGNVYSSLIIIRFVMPSFAGDVMQLSVVELPLLKLLPSRFAARGHGHGHGYGHRDLVIWRICIDN